MIALRDIHRKPFGLSQAVGPTEIAYFECSEAAIGGCPDRANLANWTVDPCNVTPMAGLEQTMGQQAQTGQ